MPFYRAERGQRSWPIRLELYQRHKFLALVERHSLRRVIANVVLSAARSPSSHLCGRNQNLARYQELVERQLRADPMYKYKTMNVMFSTHTTTRQQSSDNETPLR
jgi:hypothetical protein